LLEAGITPGGLGARDTLRLEAGLPLHGHELGPGITPLQARLGWVVRWNKGDFRGRAALLREKEAGPARLLDGLAFAGRQPGRDGARVLRAGKDVGFVTSGNFSPTLGHAIAFAFLPPDTEPETAVEVDVRGKRLPATVVPTPFVKR
jgi:aminomethyltransferase